MLKPYQFSRNINTEGKTEQNHSGTATEAIFSDTRRAGAGESYTVLCKWIIVCIQMAFCVLFCADSGNRMSKKMEDQRDESFVIFDW